MTHSRDVFLFTSLLISCFYSPEFPRGHAETAAELQVEVGNVVKAAVHGDLHDGSGCVLQRLRCLPDADFVDVPDAAHADRTPEKAHEIALRKSEERSEFCDRHVLRIVLPDEAEHSFQLLPRLPVRGHGLPVRDIARGEQQIEEVK